MKRDKLHRGKQSDCKKCAQPKLGVEECFRRILAGGKK
jgi:hypothetical protein